MAVSPSSPSMVEAKPVPEPENPHRSSEQYQSQPDLAPPSSSYEKPPSNSSLLPSESPAPPLITQSTPVQFFNPSLMAPSFRPVNQIQGTNQFSLVPNPSLQNPSLQNPQNPSLQNLLSMPNQSLQPPGVFSAPISMSLVPQQSVTPLAPGTISITVSPIQYQIPGQPNAGALQFQAPRSFVQMPNGFAPVPSASAHTMPPHGIPRYPNPYTAMVRPTFPPRPPATISGVPPLSRPHVPGIHGVPPMVNPTIRPAVPIIAMTEKPQTTVYVGKIAPTVENDFLLSLLRLCGPIKSWKRAQDPTNGSPRGFGFCEFESAEGVLRALRLLSKFNVDGQELVLNVNQATKDYLDRYVQKKVEREKKLKEAGTEDAAQVDEAAPGVENHNPPKPASEESKKNIADDSTENLNKDPQKFGIVTEEDREGDSDASEKLTNMMEERLKNKPLPPPPPVQTPADASGKSNSEVPSKSRDGDSDVDIMKSDAGEDKNDDETTSESRPNIEHERPEMSTPDRGRRYNKRSRERDRERDLKREKERELERYERERERERVRRERERELRTREAERLYKERVKEWESRERDKEYQRQHEKEREKERQRERQKEIMDEEDESDEDDSRKRRRRSSALEEKRKKRQREKDDDLADWLREEEEIAEAKKRAIEDQQQQKAEAMPVSYPVINGNEQTLKPMEVSSVEGRGNFTDQAYESDSGLGEAVLRNGAVIGEDDESGYCPALDSRQNNNLPTRKLGFGLVGSGKRTTVPSVFHEEDDEDMEKEKKMRPLVPIDYSTEEMQAVQATVSGTPPNLVAAAEFAKRITKINPKEEKPESERERSRRLSDRSSERDREHGPDKAKVLENKKLLDAKQLIDMIPKTKEELFSYDINWAIYDKHGLHDRMKPWIAKKITEFLGEEEATLVEYIVSSTKDHVQASQMLELLQSILDDEAEMFVLKMWRMLIFEIKKVETGLSFKARA